LSRFRVSAKLLLAKYSYHWLLLKEGKNSMPSKRMVRMVSATEAKNRFGAIIKQAYADDEHLIIERGGIPVVAIVPIQDYARLIREEELSSEVAASVAVSSQAAGARTHLRTFLSSTAYRPPATAEAEIEQDIQTAITAVRQAA
jgi:prevent-host-death family protein